MILLIAILAAFLRFFRLEANLVFHGELGSNYLAIKDFIASGTIPLLGPPTSHPWLSFGPLFYYIFAPVLVLFKYNPAAGAYFIAATQVALIFVNYHFVKKLFRKKVALISSFLVAISPLFLSLARQSRFFSLVTIFFYPFFYFLVTGNLFQSGLFFGIMLNFHLTPIVFIPAIIVYLIRKKTKKKDYLRFLGGLAIPSLPFLIYNLSHQFEMLKNLTLWVPYRVGGFLGIVSKNSPTNVTIINNFYSLSGFISGSFAYRPIFGVVFVLIIAVYVVLQVKKNWKAKKIEAEFLLVLFFLFGYAGIFIHGNPPAHYYLPLYSIPIIFVAIMLKKIKSKKIIVFILALLLLINFNFFFSKGWFYLPQKEVIGGQSPYHEQIEISKQIIKDANGAKFSIKRVGKWDEFDENYSQNYRYLLWWLGNEPVKNAKIVYTIYELEGQRAYFSRSSN